jgi:hypothetical protein
MERNTAYARDSAELRDGAAALADRALDMAGVSIRDVHTQARVARGGRKAHQLDVKAQL